MATVVSRTSHRNMPGQTVIYSTSPSSPSAYSSASSSRKSSSPGLSSISRISSNHSHLGDNRPNPVAGSGRFSSYTPTTISSYNRRRTDVEGLPGPEYFTSGQSRVDRRREYVQPLRAPTPPSPLSGVSSARRSAAGKQMVKYRDPRAYDSGDEDEDRFDDSRTLGPNDSISQVSYPSSYTSSSSKGRRGERRDSGVGAGSTFSKISTFQSEQVYDGTRQCYLVERRPRASVMAVR